MPSAWWALLRDATAGWISHSASTLGAVLAFYSLFALGPVMLISIAIAGLVFGEEAVRGQVSGQLAHLLASRAPKA